MQRRRRKHNAGAADQGGMGIQLLALSLFIMLLAFFIVLNALSNFEQTKVRPVIDSISFAFAARILDDGNEQPSQAPSPEKSAEEGDTLEKLESLFRAHIPDYEAVKSDLRGTMYVRVPFDEFEQAVMNIGNAPETRTGQTPGFREGFFLPAMVALLNTSRTGRPYHIDMFYNVAENPAAIQSQEPQRMNGLTARMSAIAERLERAGVPQKQQTVGIQQGEPGMVDILFRPYVPFNPLGEGYE